MTSGRKCAGWTEKQDPTISAFSQILFGVFMKRIVYSHRDCQSKTM